MNKPKIISALAIISSVVVISILSGCATKGEAQTITPPGQTVGVNSEPGVTSGAVYLSNQNTGIWVTGQGTVSVVPDVANLTMGVQVQATTVTEALNQAAQSANAVISAIKAKGVADQDIQTQGYNISPVYGQSIIPQPPITVKPPVTGTSPTATPAEPAITYPGQSVIVGYEVTNTISITIRNIGNAAAIIDSAAQAGGNATRVQGIYFSISDPTKYNTQARALAVADAKSKAQQLATGAGVTLGPAIYISENQGYVYPVYASGAAVPSASTPISPGQTQISISVQIVFSIQ